MIKMPEVTWVSISLITNESCASLHRIILDNDPQVEESADCLALLGQVETDVATAIFCDMTCSLWCVLKMWFVYMKFLFPVQWYD